jgi:hypothetical protein
VEHIYLQPWRLGSTILWAGAEMFGQTFVRGLIAQGLLTYCNPYAPTQPEKTGTLPKRPVLQATSAM